MIYYKTKYFVITLIIFLFFFITSNAEPIMFAHYINVGQADATLLEFPCGAILIDAGTQDNETTDNLIQYLDNFFERRTDLNNTLESIIITHNHIDHTRALREVVERYTVHRYIDNGQTEGSGTGDPNWIRRNNNTDGRYIVVDEIIDSEITNLSDKTGLTSPLIDPLVCTECDPEIRILSGRLDDNPGWPIEEFDNKNNQSLVIRVDFGEASFIFTGDLETDAIETLVDYYTDTELLDIDVYQVGHHGSYNATTASLVEAMTPDIAVISCGQWNFGQDSRGHFNTYSYGHPRIKVLNLLSVGITKKRSPQITVQAAASAKNFEDYKVKKKIYATPWDGSIIIRAKLDGSFRVNRNQ